MPIEAGLSSLLEGFEGIPWADRCAGPELFGAYLYVLVAVKAGQRLPIYVGQTRRFRGRMGDYGARSFSAATDFKVGEAITVFEEAGYSVEVFYRLTSNSIFDEKELIREVQFTGYHILNELSGYSYLLGDKDAERGNVNRFSQMLIREACFTRLTG